MCDNSSLSHIDISTSVVLRFPVDEEVHQLQLVCVQTRSKNQTLIKVWLVILSLTTLGFLLKTFPSLTL